MNECYKINGVSKPFLQWCKEYGVLPLQVRALMSLGAPLEWALSIKEQRRIVLICMGEQVKSLTEWCRIYGIAPATFRRRINTGFPLHEAFEAGRYGTSTLRAAKRREEPEYIITQPFLTWCRDYGANPLHVRAAMSTGLRLEYALKHPLPERPGKLVIQLGGHTDTFLRMCKTRQKSPNVIRRRVADGMPLEDAFALPALKRGELQRLTEIGKVNEAHSIAQTLSAWCRDYQVRLPIVRQRLDFGMELAQALTVKKPE